MTKKQRATRDNVKKLRILFDNISNMQPIIEKLDISEGKKEITEQYGKIVESLNDLTESYIDMLDASSEEETDE